MYFVDPGGHAVWVVSDDYGGVTTLSAVHALDRRRGVPWGQPNYRKMRRIPRLRALLLGVPNA